MRFAKHQACGGEVIAERLKETMVVWCPECGCVVAVGDLDLPGPFALVSALSASDLIAADVIAEDRS